MARGLAAIFEVITIVAGVCAGIFLMTGLGGTNSAVQDAEVASIAIAMVAIPYCIAGAAHRQATRSANDRNPTGEPAEEARIHCDTCRELIMPRAKKCHFCGQEYEYAANEEAHSPASAPA